jgi:hypothetical protein
MPIYTFKDNNTGEVQELLLSFSEREKFLKENPNIKQLITGASGLISGTNFNKRMDNGWKENLARISEAHPNSALAEKLGGKNTTQAKVSEIAKKHGRMKGGKYTMDL